MTELPQARRQGGGEALRFGHYVIINTEHVRCATAELLTAWAALAVPEQPIGVISTDCGWLLATAAAMPTDSASELPAILAFGRAHGCDYVMIDANGPIASDLPTFPW